jgi:hypothetical protein
MTLSIGVCNCIHNIKKSLILRLSFSLSSVFPTLYHRTSVKRFVSLQFINPKTLGRTPWTGDQLVARPLPTTQTQNKHRQTSVPWVGFEPTIPMFERVKTVHALDRSANVTGNTSPSLLYLISQVFDWRAVVREVWTLIDMRPDSLNVSSIDLVDKT